MSFFVSLTFGTRNEKWLSLLPKFGIENGNKNFIPKFGNGTGRWPSQFPTFGIGNRNENSVPNPTREITYFFFLKKLEMGFRAHACCWSHTLGWLWLANVGSTPCYVSLYNVNLISDTEKWCRETTFFSQINIKYIFLCAKVEIYIEN